MYQNQKKYLLHTYVATTSYQEIPAHITRINYGMIKHFGPRQSLEAPKPIWEIGPDAAHVRVKNPFCDRFRKRTNWNHPLLILGYCYWYIDKFANEKHPFWTCYCKKLQFLKENFVEDNGAVDGNWWDSEVKVGAAKENGSQEKGQLTITKMRSVQKQK